MFHKCGHAYIFTGNNISKLMGFSLMVIVLYPWHSFCCQMTKQNRWQFPGSSGKIVCWYFSIELGRHIFCKDTSRFQSNTFFLNNLVFIHQIFWGQNRRNLIERKIYFLFEGKGQKILRAIIGKDFRSISGVIWFWYYLTFKP